MKIFTKFIGLLIAFTLATNVVFAFYQDVPAYHEHYDSIKALYDMGRLPTDGSNLFNPDSPVKTTDFYRILIEFSGTPLSKEANLPFTDVNNNDISAKYIQTAIDLNILTPQGLNPELGIDKTMSKHRTLSILFESLGVGTSHFFDKEQFRFADLDPYSDTAIIAAKAAELGILEKENENLFKMAKRISKAELASYLYAIYQYSPSAVAPSSNYSDKYYSDMESDLLADEDFEILLDVWSTLHTDYIYKNDLNDSELIYGAVSGMVNELDDEYTIFQDPEEASILLDQLSNQYEGIGMIIEMIEGNITIVSPFKNSPAEKAGLKSNDIIIKVDDENIVGESTEYVVNKIKGPAGSSVKLTINRNGSIMDFNITRESVHMNSVNYEVLYEGSKRIAYIEILSFTETTSREFETAAYTAAGDDIEGIILDLRSNPGGFMDTAIDILSYFTEKSRVAVILEFSSGSRIDYRTSANGLLKDYPVVILINEGSASAAEIVAGALRDYGIATIVGTKSFGKGSVQEITQYNSGAIFKFTISEWLTPNGTNINGVGVSPDIAIARIGENDSQLERALEEF